MSVDVGGVGDSDSDSNRRMRDVQGGRDGDGDGDDGVITATHAHIIHAADGGMRGYT